MDKLEIAEQAIERQIDGYCTSTWLRNALQDALKRDAVDAANDAEALAHLLRNRCNALLHK